MASLSLHIWTDPKGSSPTYTGHPGPPAVYPQNPLLYYYD